MPRKKKRASVGVRSLTWRCTPTKLAKSVGVRKAQLLLLILQCEALGARTRGCGGEQEDHTCKSGAMAMMQNHTCDENRSNAGKGFVTTTFETFQIHGLHELDQMELKSPPPPPPTQTLRVGNMCTVVCIQDVAAPTARKT